MAEVLTVDDLLIEACGEDAEIEDGYFSESLKFALDRDIDEDINNNMNSIFSGEGLSLDETIINLVDRLEAEVNDSESGEAKLYIADEVIEDPIESELPGRFSSTLYDWVDEDDPDHEKTWYGNDSGDYNTGYDSIFGDN
jgi:hypothetical protein